MAVERSEGEDMSRLRIAIGTGAAALLLAVGSAATVTPTSADTGGVEPLTYGHCLFLSARFNPESVQTIAELTAPFQGRRGQGNADQIGVACEKQRYP